MAGSNNFEARVMRVRIVLHADAQGALRPREEPGEEIDLVVVPQASADGATWTAAGERA